MAPSNTSTPSSPPPASRDRRSFQVFGGRRFSFTMDNIVDVTVSACTTFVETFVLLLGPLLICFASAIITGLSWVFFTIYLPMMQRALEQQDASPIRRFLEIGGNIAFVVFILVEIIFNYFMCVTTRNAGPSSSYDKVVRELAESTDFEYPTTPHEVARFRRDFNDKMMLRMRRRQARDAEQQQQQHAHSHSRCCDANGNCSSTNATASTNTSTAATTTTTVAAAAIDIELAPSSNSGNSNSNIAIATGENITLRKNTRQQQQQHQSNNSNNKKTKSGGGGTPNTQIRGWMLMAPDEWGYCPRTNQPKPPRSHYDHVSKSLVLCLDHYCPWMFNAIGYFNYRYFVNFLVFVFTGMMYGALITYRPFVNSTGPFYREQVAQFRKTGIWSHIHPYTPISSERMPISLGFMLCLAVGIAVACLGAFHIYLVLTGQTTIEFHGNFVNKAKAKRSGQKYRNPYDMGLKRNWQQVYSDYNHNYNYNSRSSRWRSIAMTILIPSKREPDFLPLPIGGEEGKRKHLRLQRREREEKEMTTITKPFLESSLLSSSSVSANIV